MHYKGPKTGNDNVIYIASAETARDWEKDKTIPLVDVLMLDGFFVFVSHKYLPRNGSYPGVLLSLHKQGAQGILDRASNAQLESEFRTHKIEEVAQMIIEKG
jgi:ribosome maturation protein Sdo1